MTAILMDGLAVARSVRSEWKSRVDALRARGVTPGLAVIIVGNNPASTVYVRNKAKACGELGIHSEIHAFLDEARPADVLAKIRDLNADPKVHGILVQLPLPKQFQVHEVLETLSPDKDVDGFHLMNLGALISGEPVFPPCTPYGVMTMLDHYQVPLAGANAVVVGRSNIVGKPQALMLLARDATVSICTSKTRDLAAYTRMADVLVVAVGRPRMITGDMVKPGATVVDVGINRLPDGKLAGDVDFDSVKSVAGHLTPVPGGVGPMTITMLLANTVRSAERFADGRVAAR
ncbi:MAG: bifunctional methylenetetrahydrofolate dehydrogenase/methenyltetrahydrofolate cyclohydrolase FolD [Burkholderiales bacterium]